MAISNTSTGIAVSGAGDKAGKNAKKIAEYIQNQLKEDQIHDQMTLKEYDNPFTGRK